MRKRSEQEKAEAPRSNKADALASYRAKRDFSQTPEPSGGAAIHQTGEPRLVIQHHYATRDHFDLRLEMDGVLKSWAVTRGPSANPKDKRLAVRTEDHPLDYGGFEGVIPKKQYGGGTVILWESTTYTPLNGDPMAALAKGEIKFESHGDRLRGRWVLVRMNTQEKRENWLLIKERDAYVEPDDALARRYEMGVLSGRDRDDIERGAPTKIATKMKGAAPTARAPVRAESAKADAAIPPFTPPQLCDPAERPPAQDGWLFEMKYDGYRLQLLIGDGQARVYTRNGLDWTNRFPALARDAASLGVRDAVIDGEAVVLGANGLSDFAALVAALETGRNGAIEFMAFDLLRLDGADLREQPLSRRKHALQRLLPHAHGRIRPVSWLEGDGAALFTQAAAAGAEGVIAKRIDSPYRSGRSSHWLKIKTDNRADVIIIGYKPSEKHESFASLLMAHETPQGLHYIGGVGTGYNARARKALAPYIEAPTRTRIDDVLNADKLPKGARYLTRRFDAEVRYGGWTSDGQMRQARFLGLRADLPRHEDAPMREPESRTSPETRGKPPARAARRDDRMDATQDSAAIPAVSHPERVVYPADGVTKGDIAAYYAAVTERIAPHLDHRLVSLLRAPQTIADELFFQRHPLKGMTKGVLPVEDHGKTYIALDGALGLRTAAQFSSIELHGWMARTDNPEHPDRIAFDLDPDEAVTFAQVRKAAEDMRDHLEAIGLRAWPMVTGGKGVHVVVPLGATQSWSDVEDFAEGFARGYARQEPARFVATMSKAQRKGRIFIDWLRNKRGATAILPWSLRARAGAPVAAPLSWAQLRKIDRANAFDIRSAPRHKDGWTDFFDARQTIPEEALAFMRAQAKR